MKTTRVLAGIAALALAVLGGAAGAALYVSSRSPETTTVMNTVTTGGAGGGTSTQIAPTPGLTAAEIFRRTHEGVVDLKVVSRSSAFTPDGDSESETSQGSGFVYDGKGNILTNQHVVDGATSIDVRFWNGKVYDGHVVGTDSSADLAIVKVSAPASILHPLTIGDSTALQVGDGVVAIGSPFGLAQTMTSGIVSALHRGISSPNPNRRFTISDSIQTDAPINHGNSGGPLLNASGQVVGVNTQIQSDSGGSDGVGFAVSSTTIQRVAPQLVLGQKVQYAYLGVFIQDAETATDATAGAKIEAEVEADTPAASAGLESGDVIVRIDGTEITASEDLTSVLDSKKPGDKITVTYLRDGDSKTTKVTLGTRPS